MKSSPILCLGIFSILLMSISAFTPFMLPTIRSSQIIFSSSRQDRYSYSSTSSFPFLARNEMNRDFYQILGIPRNADSKEIKRAYRRKAKQYHPDVNSGDTTEKFQEINRAYEVLNNIDLKKKYDMYGEAGVGTSAASEAQAGNPFGGSSGFSQQVDLGDIFDSFFGGVGMGSNRNSSRNRNRDAVSGEDLRFDLDINFKTALFGGEEKVRIRHLQKCDTCMGNGIKPGSKANACNVCSGRGLTIQVTRTPLGNFQTQQTCVTCRGTGQRIEQYCRTCSGKGVVSKSKQIKVTVPPGVENGNKLRVRNEGDASPNGGSPGDLYIFLKVRKSSQFRREGPDIYSIASISFVDAILGSSIKTPVIDGEVTIKIPPGMQPGQVMRLRGSGAPRLGNPDSRGDHFVTVNVEIPKDLSTEENVLIGKLKDLMNAKNKKKVLFF